MPRRSPTVWLHLSLLTLGLVGCCAVWLGCSEKQHYKTLSFFFDGVPDPDAPPEGQNRNAGLVANKPDLKAYVSIHKPFAEQKCGECHVASVTRNTPASDARVLPEALDSSACIRCHDKVSSAHPMMHQAVLQKNCTWCHQSHESNYPKLLRTDSSALCFQCHEQDWLTRRDGHQVRGPSCLSCHSGHGGKDKGHLLPTPAPGEGPAKSILSTQPTVPPMQVTPLN